MGQDTVQLRHSISQETKSSQSPKQDGQMKTE